MIRLIGILIGLGFTGVVLLSFVVGAYTAITEDAPEYTAYDFHEDPVEPEGGFAFDGAFGKWDVAQLQRGYQVYKEVCAACHSLDYVAFRDLAQLGYSDDQVKAEAASWQVPGINPDNGEPELRAALPTDYFPSPYPNDVAAAAANNNAIPPDLSLMAKAREDGTNYIYSLLIGYEEPSARLLEVLPDAAPGPNLYHNPYFANLNLAMAPPLTSDGQVTYSDETPATIEQMSADVAAFLTWTAEPSLIDRKAAGWPVLIFLLFATILAWMAKKQIWAAVKPDHRRDEIERG